MTIDSAGRITELRGDVEAVLRAYREYEAIRRGGTVPVAPAEDEVEPQSATRQEADASADPDRTDGTQPTPGRRIKMSVIQGATLVGAAAVLALAERIVGLLSG
ncbi:hypothetical protein ACIPM2_35150 [Streptomyces sp. NPDC086081]|jgi:hypothetical protein|uniref:hypothetical protein n=1 Tax=Streptomyces sp. NPDC086081 TaxID=3365749 RepID=UPI0038116F17